MQLTPEQSKGFDIAVKGEKRITTIAGYAGCGKSVLLKEVADHLGTDVLTPTHKSAQVLRSRGIDRARTYHSVLYQMTEVRTYELKDGTTVDKFGDEEPPEDAKMIKRELFSGLRDAPGACASIACVDEASMVSAEPIKDMLDVYDRIILFGDPFQLPPVKAKDIFNSSVPDLFLKEVHRAALESPITRYATELRNGNDNPSLDGIQVINPKSEPLYEILQEKSAQVIVWTNQLRHRINESWRKQKGYEPNTLLDGEEAICLSNVRTMDADGNRVLKFYNGQMVKSARHHDSQESFWTPEMFQDEVSQNTMSVWPFWQHGFFTARQDNSWWDRTRRIRPVGHDMDYAYALTAHKAQGSEWPVVAVVDQRAKMKSDAARWFYTAVTRASEELILVLGG